MSGTKLQRQHIYRLCDYNKELKEELVQWITEDVSKISTHDLSFEQANAIIVNRGAKAHRGNQTNWGAFDQKNSKHMKILSLCIEYGWKEPNPKTGFDRADLQRLGQWLHHQSPVKKPMKQMDQDKELPKVIKALEIMIRKKYK